MAIMKCRECLGQVSDQAGTCPHCGAPVVKQKPPPKKLSKTDKILLVPLTLIFVLGIFSWAKRSQEEDVKKAEIEAQATQAAEVNADAQKASCKKDLQCWGDKGSPAAGAYCRDQIEKLATHSMRWTDRFLEPKFSHFRWLDKDRATVTFSGDKAEFQNGFGAYTTVTYECDFDQDSKQVLDVRVREGRL